MRQLTTFNVLAILLIFGSLEHLCSSFTQSATAQEIGFLEEFALAADREKVLKQLVPGTEKYYFFHCLHYQNTQQLEKVDAMLKPWIKRFGYTPDVNKILTRQSLLNYVDDPAATLKFLTQKLNLNFNHQREIPQTQRDLPTKLDPKLLNLEKLVDSALSRYQNTDGITDQGLRLLANKQLDKSQLRHLLERLRYPDYPKLVDLIIRDLKQRDSHGFGQMEIHRALTLDQLDELAKKFPKVAQHTSFVNVYLGKLAPSEDVNWRADATAHRLYLERLWEFVKSLSPSHNSLKACILFRRLDLDRSEGKYDLKLFKTYLALPRSVGYINRNLIKSIPARNQLVNLNEDFQSQTRLAPIGNDEPLVREYLQHFLKNANNTEQFESFVETKYLNRQFATVKILNGLGDSEKWVSLLTPEQYKELLNRVDLDFVATNPDQFDPSDAVKLQLDLKNVKKLIVKVFEINTENYYRKYNSEIDTNINLDGLVPNSEKTYQYEEEPGLRIKRSFEFPQIDKRGVYIVDFIAGGKSSRALIRKGRLQLVGETTAAGQLFTVLDQNGEVVKGASLWISGRRYSPDDQGKVLVPFSTQSGRVNAIIKDDEFSCLQTINHVAEEYQFSAAMLIDREALIRSNTARVLIRPSLRIASGNAVPLSLLKEPQLVVTSVNQDGISSTKIISDLKLSESAETVCEFVVPPRLKSIQLALTAKIENISQVKTETFSASQSYTVNNIDVADVIQDVHLVPTDRGFVLEVLGKTGEPRAKQAVRINVQVSGIKKTVAVDLQSDALGHVQLGELENAESIKVKLVNGVEKSWYLATEDHTYPQTINGLAGEAITIAAPVDLNKIERARTSLFEKRRGTFVAQHFDSISLSNGLISIEGLSPGDYLLRMNYRAETNRPGSRNILIRVTKGKRAANTFFGKYRHLENRRDQPLQILSIDHNEKTVTVKLANAKKNARMHVFVNRYQPAFTAFGTFASIRDIEPWIYRPSLRQSVYMQGRKIGDEYQYILDRKYAAKYPGNMLQRPSLLLNPWTTKSTDNRVQDVAEGDEFQEFGNEADRQPGSGEAESLGRVNNTDFANLDFLGEGAILLANLSPDEDGVVKIDAEKLGSFPHIRVVAVDGFTTCQRNFNRAIDSLNPRDSRLVHSLDPEGHFSQSKQIEVLNAKDQLIIEDIISAKFQYYDDLNDVFRLFKTLNSNSSLNKFEFILSWLDQPQEKKRKLYSEHACHELNFFLFKKDQAFFEKVVVQHLKNKRNKTFLDHWLLKDNLDEFTDPWKYARLNIFERILLAQRLENQSLDIVRNVTEMYMLSPTPRAQFDGLYDTGIRGLSLDESILGKNIVMNSLRGPNDQLPRLQAPPAAPGGMGGGGGGAGGGRPRGDTRKSDTDDMMDLEGTTADESRIAGRRTRRKELASKEKSLSQSLGRRNSAGLAFAPQEEIALRLESRTQPDGSAEFFAAPAQNNESLGQVPFSAGTFGYYGTERLSELREQTKNLYRRVPPTQEWMENNYYQLLPEQQTAELVTANRFWLDYAKHDGGTFLSPYFVEAHRGFTEMMFALAVIDLPMKGPEQNLDYADAKMTFTSTGPTIAFHQQVENAIVDRGNTTILVSENFFDKKDRYRFEDGVRFDKFISDEFHAHTLYGGQVVITNPTSTPRAVELLIQIPEGAVSCSGSPQTKTSQLDLEAFSTKTYEYAFYFPTAGKFKHYPAHVSADEKVLAIAEPVSFAVTDQPAKVNKDSWAYVSQNGSEDQVIEFLNQQNILRLDLDRIAFRMKEESFFLRALKTLRNRFGYNHLLWSYSLKHNDRDALREFLSHSDPVTSECGPYLETELLTLNPVERNWYQHREYWPLINARAHQLGPQRKILNPSFLSQYQDLMNVLAHRQVLDNDDHLVVTYYMLLQDRIETALQHFDNTKADSLASNVQYAYCDAYLDIYREKPEVAASKAAAWADYPVDHWRNRFKNILTQVEEIRGGTVETVDEKNQTQKQTELAAKSESFDLEVNSGAVSLNFQNLKEIQVNFYEMDIELLFSRSPFAQDDLDGFSMIRPNVSQRITLNPEEDGKGSHELKLPKELENKNLLVEVVSGDQAKSQPYFANSLDVQMVENYGQLQVSNKSDKQTLSKTYVKVYARMNDGTVSFHKDGYTDLRGRFDYFSQSNNPSDGIQKLSVLILSEQHGAAIRQVKPPKE